MRKNGINRELTLIDGGVCAPCGFYATDVCCDGEESSSFGIVLADKRCERAYLPTLSANISAFVSLSQTHTQKSLSSGVVFYNGGACTQGEKQDDFAERASRLLANALKIDRNELILVSLGKYGKKLELSTFENASNKIKNKGVKDKNSLSVAKVLSKDRINQMAFSFQIGDVECKIGAIFCGGVDNLQPLVCMLTTDVDISSQMLQKALKAAFSDGFYMFGGRMDTPNDCVFALANGCAGNWKITENNSDYQKFSFALCEAVKKICKNMLETSGEIISCQVYGAKSKSAARDIAKAVVSSSIIKTAFHRKKLDTQAVLAAVLSGAERVSVDKLSIVFCSTDLEIVTFEDDREILLSAETEKTFFEKEKREIIVKLNEGNYSASAYGSFYFV